MKVTEKQLTEFRQKLEGLYSFAAMNFNEEIGRLPSDTRNQRVGRLFGETYVYRLILIHLYKDFYNEELPDEFKRF